MAVTISAKNISTLGMIVSGSYVGLGGTADTTIPIGHIPKALIIIAESTGDIWIWGYGMGWSSVQWDASADDWVRSRTIFQYLGKRLDRTGETGDDYAEAYIADDDIAGVRIAGNVGPGADLTPNVEDENYVFTAFC